MIASIFKLHFKRTKNKIIVFIIVLYSVLFSIFTWYSSSDYLESEGNLHMSRSRVANTQAMTLIKLREFNSRELADEGADKKIEFFSELSKHELTVGKFLLSGNKDNDRFINLTLNKIYGLYITSIQDEVIPLQEIKGHGFTFEELRAREAYTLFLDGYKEDLVLNPYEVNSANMSMRFFSGINLIVLTSLIILLIFDGYLTHIHDGSYKIMYTLEYSRKQVFISKVAVELIIGVTMFIVSFCTINMIGFFIGGLGDWKYPMMSKGLSVASQINSVNSFSILPLHQIVTASFVLYLFMLASLITLILLISLKTDSTNASIGVFFCIVFLSVLLNATQSESSIIKGHFPYSYLFIENVWSVKEQFNLWYGYVSNITLLLVSLIYMRFEIEKKDLLGGTESQF